MAKCNFNIAVIEPIEILIEKAKNGITSIGGTFEGTTEKGTFSIPTKAGKIIGNYSVNHNSIEFEITDKPILVGCKKIETELKKYLSPTPEEPMNFE
ncbi:hypothetical protein [Flavobacterium sp.]|uniref:hypothetical protein n=1 Tax=Flavobacterium sp. TaxID=239 RepID=UPI001215FE63|nr:hypothetical protein [Flavobacterium sp.]RZJ72568.1 MAG: hypothetical protein EOO49_06560 [Flavobacterium sp.]